MDCEESYEILALQLEEWKQRALEAEAKLLIWSEFFGPAK